MKPFKFLIARLSEVSTWKGIFLILTAAGATLRPEMQAAITAVGLSITGLIGVLVPDQAQLGRMPDTVPPGQ